MQEMRACIPGLPERGQSEANIETCEWNSGDDVPPGIELWGCRNRIGQPWDGDRKNECISGSSSSYKASAWTEARKATEWIQDKSSWSRCEQCTL